MSKFYRGWLLTALLPLFVLETSQAAGTAAGTVIPNVVTLSYSLGGVASTVSSAPATVTVDERIAYTLAWQDAAPVNVNSPDSNDPLHFILVNTGNGSEPFNLVRDNAVGGDQYDPLASAVPIYLESNGTPGLQTGAGGDTPLAGSLILAADAARSIYVLSDTPPGLADGSSGEVLLSATSATPGAAGAPIGTVLNGQGDGGVAALVAVPQAQAGGRYRVGGLAVVVAKSVVSPTDPNALLPGVSVTYRLQVSVTGSGTAANLVVTDPLPSELAYQPNSTRVGALCNPCSDSADADPVAFAANTLSVSLGNVVAPASFTIEFQATLN